MAHTSLAPSLSHTLLTSPSGFGHRILLVNIFRTTQSKPRSELKKVRWNLKKADWEKYKELAEIKLKPDLVGGGVDQSLKRIMINMVHCAKMSVPRGRLKKYTPFWNEELEKLKSQRDNARIDAERTKSVEDRKILKQTSAKFRKEVIQAKRNSFRTFLRDLDFRKDGIKAHKFVSKLNNQSIPEQNNPMTRGSKILTQERDIAKYFCDHYAKVSNFQVTGENKKFRTNSYLTCPTEEEVQLFYNDLERHELDRALKKNKNAKSAGPDEIMPEFLNNLGDQARNTLLKFMNLVWNTHLPSEWRKAEIVPILKKDKDLSSPANFRPVALTSVFCKVYERMTLWRLQQYFESNRILSTNQAGFVRHRNTTEQVLRLSQEIKDGFHRKQSTLAVFVDFKTAFDRVWRKKLVSKLTEKGVKGNMLNSIVSYLAQRFIRVRYNNSTSNFKQTRQGLPQGSVIGPFLFNIMMDDLISEIQAIPGIQALLYADDLVIWATSSSTSELENALMKALELLNSWTKRNEMLVNPLKTEYELFTLSTKKHSISLSYDGQSLTQTNEATYLGIKMDTKLNWIKQTENLASKGNRRIRLLSRLTGTKWGACQDVLTHTYTSYVRPAMEYGAEVIATASDATLKKLETTQNHALRIITGAPKSTPITAMEIQCGIQPLGVRRDMAVLRTSERLKRLGLEYWEGYIQPTQRLKTQNTFLSMAEQIGERYDLPTGRRQRFPELQHISQKHLAHASLNLIKEVKKGETPEYQMKALALETIHERFPGNVWLHVYTDGSAEHASRNAGAGVYSPDFRISEAVGQVASNFDGEVRAVLLALKHILTIPVTKVVFFVDSQPAIISLTSWAPSESNDVIECRSIIDALMNSNVDVVLQWIPSHCGIRGNEEADRLAKAGAAMTQPVGSLTFDTAKRLIRTKGSNISAGLHAERCEGKRWAVLADYVLPKDLSRGDAVACFRLITGHDYLRAHLHRIGVVDDPGCVLCGAEIMNGDHLFDCQALIQNNLVSNIDDLSSRAKLYWAARRLMAERQ